MRQMVRAPIRRCESGSGWWIGGAVRCFIFFFSFVESPNSLQGKKKCKKGGHVRGKTWGGFSFFLYILCFFLRLHHICLKASAYGSLRWPASQSRRGGWGLSSRWRVWELWPCPCDNKWGCVSTQGLNPSKAESSISPKVLWRTNLNQHFR